MAILAACQTPPLMQATSPLLAMRSIRPVDMVQSAKAADNLAPLCRLGLNVSSFVDAPFYIDNFDIAPLRAGWYIDYRAAPSAPANNGATYAMVMSVSDDDKGNYRYGPTGAALDELIAAHPGGIYIMGNEPDRRDLQHDVLPENYAYIYHEAYTEIKRKDPSAQVWAGAIVQPTPIRLQYLDRVLNAYQARYQQAMPVDGWAIHSFLLNERSCKAYNNDLNVCWGADIPPGIDATDGEIRSPQDNARIDLFSAGIVRFRTWMAENGYRNSPLYVSEYGVLMPPVFGFPPSTVNTYMSQTFDYMLNTKDDALGYPADDNRLVQRLAWFSTFDPNFNGYLYESVEPSTPMSPPFVLSVMGEHYRDLAAQEQESSDLAVLRVDVVDAPRQLVATIGNSGNRLAPTRATLRFYEGETFESATPIGESAEILLAGCGETTTLTVAWDEDESVDPTTYRIWAQVSQEDFMDADSTNNVRSHDAFVNGVPTFLPALKRTVR